jgi:hypothetical protein
MQRWLKAKAALQEDGGRARPEVRGTGAHSMGEGTRPPLGLL